MVAVEDLGQGIEQGLLPDLALQSADGRDVAAHDQAVVGPGGEAGEDQLQLQVLVVEHDLHLHGRGALLQELHVPGLFLAVHGPGQLKEVAAGQEGAVAARGVGDGPLPVRGHDQVLHGGEQVVQEIPLMQGLEFQHAEFGQVLDHGQDGCLAVPADLVARQGERLRAVLRARPERAMDGAMAGFGRIAQEFVPGPGGLTEPVLVHVRAQAFFQALRLAQEAGEGRVGAQDSAFAVEQGDPGGQDVQQFGLDLELADGADPLPEASGQQAGVEGHLGLGPARLPGVGQAQFADHGVFGFQGEDEAGLASEILEAGGLARALDPLVVEGESFPAGTGL